MSQVLDRLLHLRLTPPDTREIWEWVEQEGELPNVYAVPGKLDLSPVPWIKDVFRALKSRRVRQVTVMAAVQCLKTLIGELWLVWLIKNDPGPTQWVQRDDTEADEHSDERFNHLLRCFPVVEALMPRGDERGKRKKSSIIFPHMWLRVEGAGLNNADRKSVRNQMCSELHDADKWPPGRLKAFASRLTQYIHNSKRYIESQPGMDHRLKIDDMHEAYLAGTQNLLHVGCLKCGFYQPMRWSVIRADGSRAGIRFDVNERTRRKTNSNDPNEVWNWQEVRNSVRWECEKCGEVHRDDDRTRLLLSRSGRFSPQAENTDGTHESFSWNQFVFPNLNWFETQIGGVKNFLIAHAAAKQGIETPLREFFQKVAAEPYDPDRFAHMTKMQTVEIVSQPEAKELVVDGVTFKHRVMGVDVQAASFWVLVMIFSDRGDELALWGGELYTWEDVEEKRKEFHVEHEDVCVDQSHRGFEVIWECCKHGAVKADPKTGRKKWLCWKAFVGSDQKHFIYRTASGKSIQLPYSWPWQTGRPELGLSRNDPRLKEMAGKTCHIIHWSNPTIKDAVIARLGGQAQGVKVLTMRGEWNDEYSRQCHSQRKVFDTGKFGVGKWKWAKFRDDHLLDCRCMATTRAIQKKLIAGGAVPE